MMFAFGTLTPTSITDVATSIFVSLFKNARITSSFSRAFNFPCTIPIARSEKICSCNFLCSTLTDFAPNLSDGSTSGQITNACLPFLICSRTKAYAFSRWCASTNFVRIILRPAGFSFNKEMCKSPYTVSASVRGMGVAVNDKKCGDKG